MCPIFTILIFFYSVRIIGPCPRSMVATCGAGVGPPGMDPSQGTHVLRSIFDSMATEGRITPTAPSSPPATPTSSLHSSSLPTPQSSDSDPTFPVAS